MKNLFKIILPVFAFFAISVFAAPNPFDIKFPVAELGNCGSMEECKVFCDNAANVQACLSWAKENGFVKESPRPAGSDQFEGRAREVLARDTGPGGCKSFEECDAFCSQPQNADACFAFAKEHNLAPVEELRKIEKRAGPGGCSSQKECDNFCRNPENAETCINFVVKEGKISQEEADFMAERMKEFGGPKRMGPPQGMEPRGPQPPQIDVEKAKKLLETEGGPGGCKTMNECDAFCGTPGNDEVCMQFAVDHGLMPAAEIERAKKMMSVEGPGGCRGRECENYCQNPEHGEECIDFAIKQGFMDPQEAEQAKKFLKLAKEPGPGGCAGKTACDEFCSRPENGEACFAFAKEHGLVSEDDIQRMEKEKSIRGKLERQGGPGGCKNGEECRSYCEDAAHFDECAAFSVNAGMMSPDRAQQMLKSFIDTERRQGDMMPPSGEGEVSGGRAGPPPGMEGRYNERLQTFEGYREEFKQREDYCSDPAHAEECRRGPMPREKGAPFMPPANMRPPEGIPQPNGMKSFEGIMPPKGFKVPEGMMPSQEFQGKPGEFKPPMPYEGFKIPEGTVRPPENTPYNSFTPQEGGYRIMQPPADMTPQLAPGTAPMPVQPMMSSPSEPMPTSAPAPTSYLPSMVGALLVPLMNFFQ